MSNNERSPLPRGLAKQRKNGKQRRKPDLRIRRTRSLLSNALVALMHEPQRGIIQRVNGT
jgi:hypothetical protein